MVTEFKRQQQRRDTTANWTALNPVLLSGEMGLDTITMLFRVGDGTTPWLDLPTIDFADAASLVAAQISDADSPIGAAISVSIDERTAPVEVRYVSATQGDGTTGLSPAAAFGSIQAAINDLSGYAIRRIVVLPGTYAIFTLNNGALTQIVAEGAIGQDQNVGGGAVIIDVPSGQWGASIDVDAASEVFQGLELSRLYFKGTAGSLGGLRVGRHSNFLLDRVGAANFPDGTGILIDGSDASQYGTIRDPQCFDCKIGLDVNNHNGLRVYGGTFEYLGGPVTKPVGSIGVRGRSGADTLRLFGTVVQFVETGITVAGEGSMIMAPRLEAFTKGVVLDGNGSALYGGSFNDYILGDYSGTTAVEIAATAGAPVVIPGEITAVATKVNDLRATAALRSDRILMLQGEYDAKLVRFRDGAFVTQGSSGNYVAVNHSLEVPQAAVVGRDNYGAPLYFGGAQDASLNRLRPGDIQASGGIYPGRTDVGIRTANGVPAAGFGFDGDFAFSTDGHLYFKSGGAWIESRRG